MVLRELSFSTTKMDFATLTPALEMKGAPIPCAAFENCAIRTSVDAGTVLSQEGMDVEFVHYLKNGLVKRMAHSEEGKEILINLQGPDSFVGAFPVLLHEASSTKTIALTHTTMLSISASDFRRLHAHDCSCASWMSRVLSRELRISLEHHLLLKIPQARRRVELFFSGILPSYTNDPLPSMLKQFEIAQLLNITPEHLSRILRQLHKEGMVPQTASRIQV